MANDVEAYQADGADVINSRGSVVRGNSLSHNNWDGLVLITSPESRITGNQLDANGNNGTEVNGGSDGVTVSGQQRRRQPALRHRARRGPGGPCRRQHREAQ